MKVTLHAYLRNTRTVPFVLAGGADVDGIAAGGTSGIR